MEIIRKDKKGNWVIIDRETTEEIYIDLDYIKRIRNERKADKIGSNQ